MDDASRISTAEQYEEFSEQIPVGYLSLNADWEIETANQKLCDLFGYEADQLPGKPFLELIAAGNSSRRKIKSLFQDAECGEIREVEKIKGKRKEGTTFWTCVHFKTICGNKGSPKQYHVTIVNISRIMEDQKMIVQKAIRDPLTGLKNRRFFMNALQREMESANRYHHPLSFVFADLDNFKKINDEHGHIAGDEVLKRVANTFEDQVRSPDTISRLGGDEFGIIFPHISVSDVVQCLKRLSTALKSQEISGDPISISFGISTYASGMEYKELINWADKALYEAKKTNEIHRVDSCSECSSRHIASVERAGPSTCPTCKGTGDTSTVESTNSSNGSRQSTSKNPEQLIGETIGRCRINNIIESGGTSVVYLGEHINLDKQIALKVFDGIRNTDEQSLQNFIEEAKIAAQLDHTNIVQIHDAGKEEDLHYIQMSYISGPSILNWLKNNGPIPEKTALKLVEPTTRALSYAHKQGILHLDVKPGNILLTEDGIVKLSDFGTAELNRHTRPDTGNSEVRGTPIFMPPEQWRSSRKLTEQSDIYSLGMTLLYFLVGKNPFGVRDLRKIRERHLHPSENQSRFSELSASDPTRELLKKMTAKQSDDRYPDMDAVLNDIRKIQAKIQI